ncbi:hypothetical protein BV20DRAFT_253242 [Pilatotrama ljubarskyi]|nr:hypothetical protein BV20DRAFT_253242 [Pilatotrama ljubarskyi]
MSSLDHGSTPDPPFSAACRARPPLGFVTPCCRAPHPALIPRHRTNLRRAPTTSRQMLMRTMCKGSDCAAQPRRPSSLRPGLDARIASLFEVPDDPPSSPAHSSTVEPSSSPARAKRGLPKRLPKNSPVTTGEQAAESRLPMTSTRSPSLVSSSGSEADSPLPSPSLPLTVLPETKLITTATLEGSLLGGDSLVAALLQSGSFGCKGEAIWSLPLLALGRSTL